MTIGLEERIALVCRSLLTEVSPGKVLTRRSVHPHHGLTLMKSRDETNIRQEISAYQRARFRIFIPSVTDQDVGTLIHAVGAPMAGYKLEFKRNYSLKDTQQQYTRYDIGQLDSQYIEDSPGGALIRDSVPKGAVEVAASQIPPPGISQNFLAPVNDTTNKRCQEWTMEYTRHLVHLGYLDAEAIQLVQSKRDPATHGIGLQPLGRG
ncbi:hypothetical protein A7D00_0016 [Trichophyton violaceum]|uniref:Uncharacterized protein n=1 Tax=Trichophyton violaceum TaxID=34388 RepID=A0A178FRF0_TRIVO|nr:hypothetical protein A7D00_0016 [Trichophyton violaceum]